MAALIERQVSEVTDSTEKSAPQAGRTGSAYPLGATLRSNVTNFSLFSTHATSIELLFFDHADSTQASEVISLDPVHNRTSHYWHTFVSEIKSGQIYGYRVHGPYEFLRAAHRCFADCLFISDTLRICGVSSTFRQINHAGQAAPIPLCIPYNVPLYPGALCLESPMSHLDILLEPAIPLPRMPTKKPHERVELLQGTLDLLVLQTLILGPTHGHSIAKTIEYNSDDVLQVEQGSLYPALHRLIKRGWISAEEGTSENNRRAKFYRLTAKGRRQLAVETNKWDKFAGAIARILRPAEQQGN